MNVAVRHRRLHADDAQGFAAIYAIYASSISAREQKPRAALQAMVARDDYHVIVAQRSANIVGVSIVFLPVSESFALLEYMAVAAHERNAGIGAGLFAASADLVHGRPAGDSRTALLLEVDSDRELTANDLAARRRRIAFYRRLGCRAIVGLPYELPLPGPGKPPVMQLMVHLAEPPPAVPRAALRRWLQIIYERVYQSTADDPRIDAMLARVGDPVQLD